MISTPITQVISPPVLKPIRRGQRFENPLAGLTTLAAMLVESGQHWAKSSVQVAITSCRQFLAATGTIEPSLLGRLGPPPGALELRNDAGEPSGTAGEPILAALRKADLSDCVGVVVRWFGGVKLGTGGLARAYGAAMETAAGNVAVREVLLGQEFEVGLPYALQKTVRHLVYGRQGKVVREEYGEGVSWIVWLPSSRCPGFTAEVIDATAGQATVTRVES